MPLPARLSPHAAAGILNSLRYGIVPAEGLEYLTVGREELVTRLRQELIGVRLDRAGVLFLEGAYGAGKSHTLGYLAHLARRQKLAVSRLTVGADLLFNRLDLAYRGLLESLQLPDSPDETGLAAIVRLQLHDLDRRWLLETWTRPADEDDAYDRLLKSALGAFLLLEQDEEAEETLLRWLTGEKVSLGPVRKLLRRASRTLPPVPSFRFREEMIADLLNALARLLRALGCLGWLILIDEGENLVAPEVTRPTRARIFRNLDHLLTGQLKGVLLALTFTPGTLQDIRLTWSENRYLTAPPHFVDREFLEENSYRLDPLAAEDLKELTHLVVDLHEVACGWRADSAIRSRLVAGLLAADPHQARPTRLMLKAVVELLDLLASYPALCQSWAEAEDKLKVHGS